MSYDPKLVEMVARAMREAWRVREHLRADTLDWPDIEDDERAECMASAIAALDALAAAGRLVPDGWVAVPGEPTDGLLMSMALRADHGLACPGYYDQTFLGGTPGQHARHLEVALADARRMHEEVVGAGFYKPEREADYRAMLAATPRLGDTA